MTKLMSRSEALGAQPVECVVIEAWCDAGLSRRLCESRAAAAKILDEEFGVTLSRAELTTFLKRVRENPAGTVPIPLHDDDDTPRPTLTTATCSSSEIVCTTNDLNCTNAYTCYGGNC
ncbi:MAG TPA: hypothetical protein VGL66_11870 [Caulobacteraceae bacterium]|jgi:hypothetical protein